MFYIKTWEMPTVHKPTYFVWAFDRSRSILDIPDLVPFQEIGKVVDSPSFETICDARAEHIARVADESGKRVGLFWSGGIDSTLVLVALRKVVAEDKLTIFLTADAPNEYPELFEKIRSSNTRLAWTTDDKMLPRVDEFLQDHILVTGEHGDQMFGSDKYVILPDPSIFVLPWRDYLTKNTNYSIETYEKLVAACPIELKTLKEFFWWFSYCLKYQHVGFRMICASQDAVLEDNFFHFFNTKAFNDWSVSTPMEERFYGTDPKQYKWIAKQYIFKELKDTNYLNNKLKEISLKTPFTGTQEKPRLRWIKTDWTRGR